MFNFVSYRINQLTYNLVIELILLKYFYASEIL